MLGRPVTTTLLRSGGVPDAGDRVSDRGSIDSAFAGLCLGILECLPHALHGVGFCSLCVSGRSPGELVASS